jgi:hypothetical protein
MDCLSPVVSLSIPSSLSLAIKALTCHAAVF